MRRRSFIAVAVTTLLAPKLPIAVKEGANLARVNDMTVVSDLAPSCLSPISKSSITEVIIDTWGGFKPWIFGFSISTCELFASDFLLPALLSASSNLVPGCIQWSICPDLNSLLGYRVTSVDMIEPTLFREALEKISDENTAAGAHDRHIHLNKCVFDFKNQLDAIGLDSSEICGIDMKIFVCDLHSDSHFENAIFSHRIPFHAELPKIASIKNKSSLGSDFVSGIWEALLQTVESANKNSLNTTNIKTSFAPCVISPDSNSLSPDVIEHDLQAVESHQNWQETFVKLAAKERLGAPVE